MELFTKLFAAGLLAWLGLLVLLVTVRMLRGDIRTTGLLSHRLDAREGKIAPERVVAMIAFPFVLGVYTLNALHADVSGAAGAPSLPDVPAYLLSLLTGGNGLYLAGKIARAP
jgi:hypothetical protein